MAPPVILAEVKTMSPFGFVSPYCWDDLFAIAAEAGDMISIHTDARWGGSWDILERARKMTYKPILAKGIHASDDEVRKAVELGAAYVLVVGRMSGVYREQCIIEPQSLTDFLWIPDGQRVMWNSRDLDTGGTKRETFAEARARWSGWLCQASNVLSLDDVHPQADAVLVGTYLKEFAESMHKDI